MTERKTSRPGFALLVFALVAGSSGVAGVPLPAETPSAPASPLAFAEIGEAAGVRFVHTARRFTGRHKHQVLEMFTAGGAVVAVGDFDADGLDDLFLTDSDIGKPNRLMRNNGDLTFSDVTAKAGVAGGNDERSIVADALWLDYDNDGHLDLLVARFGTPILYRSLGAGEDGAPRFRDVSEAAGLVHFGNTIAAIAFDYDNDGFLDLLFANYFQPLNLLHLDTPHVLPNNLDDAENGGGVTLWRSVPLEEGAAETSPRGFVEVTEEAGLAHHTGWSLDLGHADLDNDGDQDVYVAGDYGTDRLFINRGDGTFDDVTEDAIGFDTRKGMNVDMADTNRDGWLDIYVTNITDEYMKECNMLWVNGGDGTFLDLSRETGTCDTDWGWAAKFADFDNDGWEDLFVVNGLRSAGEKNYIPVLVEMIITPGVDFTNLGSYPDIEDMTWSGYQKSRLFHNLGDGSFREAADAAGVGNDLDGRGLGVADFDKDGRLDFYQSNVDQPSLLYHNRSEAKGHWLQVKLVGTRSNRDAIGARVEVVTGGESQIREVNGGNGYAGQSSLRLHFGLGAATKIDSLKVRWPSGLVQTFDGKGGDAPPAVDSFFEIVEAP